jgi:hypothetical protein
MNEKERLAVRDETLRWAGVIYGGATMVVGYTMALLGQHNGWTVASVGGGLIVAAGVQWLLHLAFGRGGDNGR